MRGTDLYCTYSLHKASDRSNAGNYRPISLLPIMPPPPPKKKLRGVHPAELISVREPFAERLSILVPRRAELRYSMETP